MQMPNGDEKEKVGSRSSFEIYLGDLKSTNIRID